MTGGSVTGGTLTGSSAAYDLEAGTVSIALGGSVGLNKTTPGTVTFTKAPPNGPYTISDGMLALGTLSKTMSAGSLTMTGGTLTGSGTLTAASGYSYNIQAGTINMSSAAAVDRLAEERHGHGDPHWPPKSTAARPPSTAARCNWATAAPAASAGTGSITDQLGRHLRRQPLRRGHLHRQDRRQRHAGQGRRRHADDVRLEQFRRQSCWSTAAC